MSDFKSYIKEKYSQEVQPEYTDDAWGKFATFAKIDPKKKDRKWLIFLLGFLLIAAVSITHLLTDDKEVSIAETSSYYQESQVTPPVITQEPSVKIIEQKQDNNSISAAVPITNRLNNSTLPSTNNNSGSSLQDPNATSASPIPNSINQNRESENIGSIPTEEVLNVKEGFAVDGKMDFHQESRVGNATDGSSGTGVTNALEKNYAGLVAISSLNARIPLLSLDRNPLYFDRKVFPVSRTKVNGEWVLGIETGAGRFYHRSINDHGAYLFSASLGYKINRSLKVRSIASILNSSYSSRVLNRSLGLRSINYPVREARLDNVNSKTSYIEAGIGIDYVSPSYEGFSISAGPALIYVKELSRKLDYNFDQGEISLESINVDVQDHVTHPFNLMLNMGLNYQLNSNFMISIKGEYLKGLDVKEIELPRQLRIKVGIEKKL